MTRSLTNIDQSILGKMYDKERTLMTDINPVLNCKTPLPSLLGSRFCASEYACSHTTSKQNKDSCMKVKKKSSKC